MFWSIVSPAGSSSRWSPTMTSVWFTVRCAGQAQETLRHLMNDCAYGRLRANVFRFSFSGCDRWTCRTLSPTDLTTNTCLSLSNRVVYDFFFFANLFYRSVTFAAHTFQWSFTVQTKINTGAQCSGKIRHMWRSLKVQYVVLGDIFLSSVTEFHA